MMTMLSSIMGSTKDSDALKEEQSSSMIEQKVCRVGDIDEGSMKEVLVGSTKILLINNGGEISAVGSKCTHFGASLINGVLHNGRIRCPWHGACFNSKTGDIEDFPGIDSLPVFQVEIKDGDVYIKAREEELKNTKRIKPMCKVISITETIIIVGGGPAALTCAETLRQEGFCGKVLLCTREPHPPYDRSKLSKALNIEPAKAYLRSREFLESYNIEVLCDREVLSVNLNGQTISFQDGTSLSYNKLFIATGGRPRALTIPGKDLDNVLYLRSLEDANQIADSGKGKNVVIFGTGFIGMEIASYFCGKALSVSVVGSGKTKVPFERNFGERIGRAVMKLHESKGVKFYLDRPAKELQGQDGKLNAVILEDGTSIQADVVIVGMGVLPATSFLKGSGIPLDSRGYVTADKYLKACHNVYAGGDIVSFPYPLADNSHINVGHWQMAHAHGRCAAMNMMGQNVPLKSVPYFWTVQFGKSIRYAGYAPSYDEIVYEGDVEELKFTAGFLRNGKVSAVVSLGMDPKVSEAAELMLQEIESLEK